MNYNDLQIRAIEDVVRLCKGMEVDISHPHFNYFKTEVLGKKNVGKLEIRGSVKTLNYLIDHLQYCIDHLGEK